MKFSQLYLPPAELVKDSQRMRTRVSSYLSSNSYDTDSLAQRISTEIGKKVPTGIASYDFDKFFNSTEIKDVLDALTVIYEELKDNSKRKGPAVIKDEQKFIDFVNKVFNEEGLAYNMESDGSVKFKPDEEFEANRNLSLQYLSEPKFNAALTAFNHAFDDYNAAPPRYKSALRNIFEANENIFKQLTSADRLTARNLELHKSIFLTTTTDSTSQKAQDKIIESYKDWVNAIHDYRHAQDVETYDEPTLEFTTLALSNGAAFLRWLASIVKK